jgi:ABC-type dipeptide/oligopeptide/nickel transport system ATPase component
MAKAVRNLGAVRIQGPERRALQYPGEFSGGMRQRAMIGMGLMSEPSLIIADEPTTALDVTVQAEILDILRNLQGQRNLAVLLVTHNFGVVADLCDRVVVMQKGKVAETGDVRRIFAEPEHPYTRTLMAAMLDGRPSRRERTEVTA